MGGPSEQTQTTRVELSPEQKKLFRLGMPFAEQFAADGFQRPEGSAIAGFDPSQTAGQEQVLSAVPQMAATVGGANTANQRLTSGALMDPNSNPALRATIDASTRPIIENLMQQVLPTIRGGAVTTGNYGSSRQGIAEGNATSGAARAVGDTAAKVATEGYNSGLDAMVKGVGLAPSTASAMSLPGTTTSGVGDVRQALTQALLGENYNNELTDSMEPLMMAQTLLGMGSGLPTAGATSTASGGGASPFSQILGGASTLAGLFGGKSGLAGVIPGMQSIGGQLGALLPFLGAASDRRLKQHVLKLGELAKDVGIYLYILKDGAESLVGVMADELEKVLPEAVMLHESGFKMVDYAKVRAHFGVK